jgi:hypothetical protein
LSREKEKIRHEDTRSITKEKIKKDFKKAEYNHGVTATHLAGTLHFTATEDEACPLKR